MLVIQVQSLQLCKTTMICLMYWSWFCLWTNFFVFVGFSVFCHSLACWHKTKAITTLAHIHSEGSTVFLHIPTTSSWRNPNSQPPPLLPPPPRPPWMRAQKRAKWPLTGYGHLIHAGNKTISAASGKLRNQGRAHDGFPQHLDTTLNWLRLSSARGYHFELITAFLSTWIPLWTEVKHP